MFPPSTVRVAPFVISTVLGIETLRQLAAIESVPPTAATELPLNLTKLSKALASQSDKSTLNSISVT